MAQVSTVSPYTIGPPVDAAPPQYVMPQSADYAVPGPDEATHDGWWDADGYATQLRTSPVGTPDATRLGELPMFETREGAGVPQRFNEAYRGEGVARHNAVEDQDADGFTATMDFHRMVPRPNPSDTGEPRPTNRMSPRSYTFLRAESLYGGVRRTLNGEHFSMADHRRDYPIGGMDAVPTRRNTYRIEPEPWDGDIVDLPPNVDPSPDLRVRAVDIPPPGNRSWRL